MAKKHVHHGGAWKVAYADFVTAMMALFLVLWPLYGYCVFAGSDGTTLQADPFRSRWSDTLAPGILQRGVIVFSGHLPAPVLQAALSFTQIFGPGGGSITVRPLNLTPG